MRVITHFDSHSGYTTYRLKSLNTGGRKTGPKLFQFPNTFCYFILLAQGSLSQPKAAYIPWQRTVAGIEARLPKSLQRLSTCLFGGGVLTASVVERTTDIL